MYKYIFTQRYYVIGSNESETRFRVFKIDRLEPYELKIYHDEVCLSYFQK